MADTLNLTVFLYRLKLSARGSGLVGEMTTLIGNAFAHILAEGRRATRGKDKPTSTFVLVVDEADALGQSRAVEQMHHEDRAGVDALLSGVDSLAGDRSTLLIYGSSSRPRASVLRRQGPLCLLRRSRQIRWPITHSLPSTGSTGSRETMPTADRVVSAAEYPGMHLPGDSHPRASELSCPPLKRHARRDHPGEPGPTKVGADLELAGTSRSHPLGSHVPPHRLRGKSGLIDNLHESPSSLPDGLAQVLLRQQLGWLCEGITTGGPNTPGPSRDAGCQGVDGP
jgi:ATPase family associated with various cellular activities (AAA)